MRAWRSWSRPSSMTTSRRPGASATSPHRCDVAVYSYAGRLTGLIPRTSGRTRRTVDYQRLFRAMPFRSASPSLSGAATAGSVRARRQFRVAVAHAPQTLRAMVRADEIWLVVLAASVGIAAGIVVVAMSETAQLMHRL